MTTSKIRLSQAQSTRLQAVLKAQGITKQDAIDDMLSMMENHPDAWALFKAEFMPEQEMDELVSMLRLIEMTNLPESDTELLNQLGGIHRPFIETAVKQATKMLMGEFIPDPLQVAKLSTALEGTEMTCVIVNPGGWYSVDMICIRTKKGCIVIS